MTKLQKCIGISRRQNQEGAALLAVLVVALVLVVLMSVASQNMQQRLTLAENSKEQMLDNALVQAKISELTYFIATQRVTIAGVSTGNNQQGLLKNEDGQWLSSITGDEIRFDGTPYSEGEGLEYVVQNEFGLIPVNAREQFWLKRWLRGVGYSHSQQVKYTDTLADYADSDDWRRPSGAEKASYASKNLQRPANFLLQSCSELTRIHTWSELLIIHPELERLCSLGRGGRVNVNALPLGLWAVLWPNSVQRLRKQRENGQWLAIESDVLALEPGFLSVPDELYSTRGARTLKIAVHKNGARSAVRVTRGNGKGKPYTIRQSYLIAPDVLVD
jgi:general secretion pathway protein K